MRGLTEDEVIRLLSLLEVSRRELSRIPDQVSREFKDAVLALSPSLSCSCPFAGVVPDPIGASVESESGGLW